MIAELEFTQEANNKVRVEHPPSNFSKHAFPKKELPDDNSVWANVVSIVLNEVADV